MKRLAIVVTTLAISSIVLFAMIEYNTVYFNNPTEVNIEGTDSILKYEINFNCSSTYEQKEPNIMIQYRGNDIYFEQIRYIYLNANSTSFWLEATGNSGTICIKEIFEPNIGVARGIKPIFIKGLLYDLEYNSFTLQFISINSHVNETNVIDSFKIDM